MVGVKVSPDEYEALKRVAGIAHLRAVHDKRALVATWLRRLGLVAAGHRRAQPILHTEEWQESVEDSVFERLDGRGYIRKLWEDDKEGPLGWWLPVEMPGAWILGKPLPTAMEAMDWVDQILHEKDRQTDAGADE